MQELSALRVALYGRVSTEEQREGQTIDSQLRELEKFAADKAWAIVGIFKDEGWSGGILARPELDRLRDQASRHSFDAVLINDVDRLARDVTHLGVIKRDLEHRGVRLIFRKLPGEQSPTHNLMVNILGSFAEFERELIADRTRRGRRYKAEVRKQFVGSIPPYGFRYITKPRAEDGVGRLEENPHEAGIVRQMYRWVAEEGLSSGAVLAKLNHMGVRPRKGGSEWQKSSVRRILRSEVYTGVWYFNKHKQSEPLRPVRDKRYRKSARNSPRLRPRGDWIPVQLPEHLQIVDRALWTRVQAQIDRNRSFSPRHSKHSYLLSGLLRCGGCDAAYVGTTFHSKFYYRCSARCRKYGSISENYVNTAVWRAMAEALKNPELMEQAIVDIDEHGKAATEAASEERAKQEDQLQKQEARLLEAYRLEIISVGQLSAELKVLAAKRKLLAVPVALTDRPEREGKHLTRDIKDHCRVISENLTSLDGERRRQILRLLLRRVVFEGDQVRIVGILPQNQGEHSATGTGPSEPDPSAVIEGTTSWNCGRNAHFDGSESGTNFPSCPQANVIFELTKTVLRDKTAALAASRANLMKANAARHPEKRVI
ncbi:MAG: recombinase family protein [Candidatus Korobacteraceae bacterium]